MLHQDHEILPTVTATASGPPCPGSAMPLHSTGLSQAACFQPGLGSPCALRLRSALDGLPTGWVGVSAGARGHHDLTPYLRPESPPWAKAAPPFPTDSKGGPRAGTSKSTLPDLVLGNGLRVRKVCCPRSRSRAGTKTQGQGSSLGSQAARSPDNWGLLLREVTRNREQL